MAIIYLEDRKCIHGYNFVERLGQGGQGIVFLVEKVDTKQRYAIKVVPPDYTPGAEEEKVQMAEKMCAERLNNAYLMKYVDYFTEIVYAPGSTKCLFLVMELCSGGDLLRLINELKNKKEKISKEVFMRLFAQSCVGMYVLRKEHILHRDLKPENIFLDSEMNAKISDFGCSKLLSKTIDPAFTEIGSMYYNSPEKSSVYSFPSDVYGLGLTFLFLGKLALPLSFKEEALTKEASNLTKENPNIPQAVADLLVAMLNQTPSLRPTMTQIVRFPDVKAAIESLPRDSLPCGLYEHMQNLTPDEPDFVCPNSKSGGVPVSSSATSASSSYTSSFSSSSSSSCISSSLPSSSPPP